MHNVQATEVSDLFNPGRKRCTDEGFHLAQLYFTITRLKYFWKFFTAKWKSTRTWYVKNLPINENVTRSAQTCSAAFSLDVSQKLEMNCYLFKFIHEISNCRVWRKTVSHLYYIPYTNRCWWVDYEGTWRTWVSSISLEIFTFESRTN